MPLALKACAEPSGHRIAFRGRSPSTIQPSMKPLAIIVGLAVFAGSCSRSDTTVVFYKGAGYEPSWRDQAAIRTIAERTVAELRPLLPLPPGEIIIRVMPDRLTNDWGTSGTSAQPNVVYWRVDPTRPESVRQIAGTYMREILFHEFHHLVRGQSQPYFTLMDKVVTEGLATAFERDFAHAKAVPFGEYPPEAGEWLHELQNVRPGESDNPWMSRHPDGRRWIGYKVGTYLADRAMKATGKSSAELARMPTEEVIALASANGR